MSDVILSAGFGFPLAGGLAAAAAAPGFLGPVTIGSILGFGSFAKAGAEFFGGSFGVFVIFGLGSGPMAGLSSSGIFVGG